MSFNKDESIYYDIFHKNNKDYKAEALLIREKFPKAKTVLEIGSGTGLMTIELEKLGFIVTGVEPSLGMINIAGEKGRLGKKGVCYNTFEDFKIKHKKYDLVLALYDVLNYVPDFNNAIAKMHTLGKNIYYEIWPKQPIKFFTYKSVDKYKRIRFGFEFRNKAYLWYIYFGNGFVVSFHKLYLHQR